MDSYHIIAPDKAVNRERIIGLLRSTQRENIGKVIEWLDENAFFEAPASTDKHNCFPGGLAKHSLEVYGEASALNRAAELPEPSVILCSLLHDVCKADQFVMEGSRAVRVAKNIRKGHGRRSMFILKWGCLLPLNYEEEMAVWWHMGEHEKSKDDFPKEYSDSLSIELCRLIRSADGIAARKALDAVRGK